MDRQRGRLVEKEETWFIEPRQICPKRNRVSKLLTPGTLEPKAGESEIREHRIFGFAPGFSPLPGNFTDYISCQGNSRSMVKCR